jgi:hypothetical protein
MKEEGPMPRANEKKARLGRNDPCWCGSGKKYKDCHLPIEDAHRAEQRKLRNAHDTLLPKLFEAAEQMKDALVPAMEVFWQGKYTVEQMVELDDLEDRGSDRFMTWLAFDYALQDGRTLVAALAEAADTGAFEADEAETRLLHDWVGVRLRPYAVEEIDKGKGMTLRDLLNGHICYVADHAASRRLEEEEVVVGHLLPVGVQPVSGHPDEHERPLYYISGAAAQLTGDTREKIIEFADLHLQDLQRTYPAATLDDVPAHRSQVFNHFVMELPEEHSPGVLDSVLLRTRVALRLAGVNLPGGGSDDREDDEREAEEQPATKPE